MNERHPVTRHVDESIAPVDTRLEAPAGLWHRLFGRRRGAKGFVLALGGGGGRGLAHLGVLDALEEHELKPSAIIGTSIGALFAAMYALDPDVQHLRERVKRFLVSDAFGHLKLPRLAQAETVDHTWLGKLTAAARQWVLYARATRGVALTHSNALIDIVRTLCAGSTFDDSQIRLYVTAVHFPSGEIQIFSRGDLVRAVAASMAVPGVFEPIEVDGQSFVDGGVASELPSKEGRMIAKPGHAVLAVDVGARPRPDARPTDVIGMLDWAIRIKSLYLRQYKAEYADVLVQPVPGFRRWSDFSHPDHEIELGRQATLEKMPELLRLIGT